MNFLVISLDRDYHWDLFSINVAVLLVGIFIVAGLREISGRIERLRKKDDSK